MAQKLKGISPRTGYECSRRIGEGQGLHREVASGGIPNRKCGATNGMRLGPKKTYILPGATIRGMLSLAEADTTPESPSDRDHEARTFLNWLDRF
jgi:hypothetical protein